MEKEWEDEGADEAGERLFASSHETRQCEDGIAPCPQMFVRKLIYCFRSAQANGTWQVIGESSFRLCNAIPRRAYNTYTQLGVSTSIRPPIDSTRAGRAPGLQERSFVRGSGMGARAAEPGDGQSSQSMQVMNARREAGGCAFTQSLHRLAKERQRPPWSHDLSPGRREIKLILNIRYRVFSTTITPPTVTAALEGFGY